MVCGLPTGAAGGQCGGRRVLRGVCADGWCCGRAGATAYGCGAPGACCACAAVRCCGPTGAVGGRCCPACLAFASLLSTILLLQRAVEAEVSNSRVQNLLPELDTDLGPYLLPPSQLIHLQATLNGRCLLRKFQG